MEGTQTSIIKIETNRIYSVLSCFELKHSIGDLIIDWTEGIVVCLTKFDEGNIEHNFWLSAGDEGLFAGNKHFLDGVESLG